MSIKSIGRLSMVGYRKGCDIILHKSIYQ